MNFKTLGNPNKPVALLIHAMFVTCDSFLPLSHYLENDYFVVLPTLNGHDVDEHTIFHSAEQEADEIISFLKKSNISGIELLLGTSLGGIIAFEIFRRNELFVTHVFLEGTPFITYSRTRIRFMGRLFKAVAHGAAKNPHKKSVLDHLFPDLAKSMKHVCGHMDDETIENLAAACYTYELPGVITLLSSQEVTFIYSTKEKARICIPTAEKFSNCNLIVKQGYRHCEFLSKEPGNYAAMLLGKAESHCRD